MIKPSTWTVDDWILVACVVAVIALLLFFATGCMSSKQTKYQVRFTKGCVIEVGVATVDSANNIMKDLDLKDCELDSGVSDMKGEKK